MKFIEVTWDDAEIKKALLNLQNIMDDIADPLNVIGLQLVESTKRRFETSTDPDGNSWAPNSPATIAKYTHSVKGTKTKDGKLLSKKGEARWDSKKPLIGKGDLMDGITYDVDGQVLEVFSDREYAAMQQFGGTKAQFPELWGDIPARPFLGVSNADEAMILSVIEKYLKNAF